MKRFASIMIFLAILIVIVYLTIVVMGIRIAGELFYWAVGMILLVVIISGILYLAGRARRSRR